MSEQVDITRSITLRHVDKVWSARYASSFLFRFFFNFGNLGAKYCATKPVEKMG